MRATALSSLAWVAMSSWALVSAGMVLAVDADDSGHATAEAEVVEHNLVRSLIGCGASGGSCCASNTIYGDGYCLDENNFHCNENAGGVCETCGGIGEQCCHNTVNGPTCNSEFAFCNATTNICTACGNSQQVCCPNFLDGSFTECKDGALTTCDSVNSDPPVCKPCGGTGQSCCTEGGLAAIKKCDSAKLHCEESTNTCELCGNHGKPCCPDPLGATGPGQGRCKDDYKQTCVDDGAGNGVCLKCGGDGEPCCNGPGGQTSCDSAHLVCNETSFCASCGGTDESCCPDPFDATKNAAPGNGTCDDNDRRTCVDDGNNGGICKLCGGHDPEEQPCCVHPLYGETCDSVFAECVDHTCKFCGREGDPCCAGNLCEDSGFLICDTDHSNGFPTCATCGGNGEPPCFGSQIKSCDSEFSMLDPWTGLCTECGLTGLPCCNSASNPCQDSSQRICVADEELGTSTCQDCGADGQACCPDGTCQQGLGIGCEPSTGMCMALALHASPHSATCPQVGDPEESVPPSLLTVSKSAASTLCMLRLVLPDGETRIPVARSYDGNDWEQYSGAFSKMPIMSCDETTCTFKLEEPEQAGATYMLVAASGYTVGDVDIAARFFESSTFGMPKSDITNLASQFGGGSTDAIAAWMETQMNETETPMTSHREFYRERLNAIFSGSTHMSQVTQPCELHTTYRQYTFSDKDFEKDVEILGVPGTSKRKLLIDGAIVTVVEGDVTTKAGDVYPVGGSYEICFRPQHFLGGRVRLRHPSAGCSDAFFNSGGGNPPVDMGDVSSDPGVTILHLDIAEAEPIDLELYQNETQMISVTSTPLSDVSTCGSLVDGPGPVPVVHSLYDSTWFLHSPRFRMREHSGAAPLLDGGGSIVQATNGSNSKYEVKCANLARNFQNEDSCFLVTTDQASTVCASGQYTMANRTLVCPGTATEVANDLTVGGTQTNGAFDSKTNWAETASSNFFRKQKGIVWSSAILSAQTADQLRQRVAWALSQIVVINRVDVGDQMTEEHLHFYDTFVRHAFGSYRDILKEVSYSGMMSQFLSYHRSKSTAYHWAEEQDVHRHPDENFAREVMQLFSIGLELLACDGTTIAPEDGGGRTYNNDDILEYSRVWTGFDTAAKRGNIEAGGNRIDPLRIRPSWRDVFPKMGLLGRYIGDGLPLCADLPHQHFLNAGARYRLLGGTSYPELQEEQDRKEWMDDPAALRFRADPSGGLFAALDCSDNGNGNCEYASVVTLTENVTCTNDECSVDTVRTIEVGDSGIFYEYLRPACSHLALYNDAKKIKMRHGGSRTYMCGDPRVEEAGSVCCKSGNSVKSYLYEEYWAELVRFSTVQSRCAVSSTEPQMCEGTKMQNCLGESCNGNPYYWTTESCDVKIKIDPIDLKVALVHNAPTETTTPVSKHVDVDSQTFFRVHWKHTESVLQLLQQCGSPSFDCEVTNDNHCLCKVVVVEEQVFSAAPSYENVLTALTIGAFPPPAGTPKTDIGNGVWVYGSEPIAYTQDTIFEFHDKQGVLQLRKNMRSKAQVLGTSPTIEFRTPVHIVSLAEENERDAQYETEAALDHYFYHPNTAPFIAHRLAQRLVTANPSPRFVCSIATAFRTGKYTHGAKEFGSGHYGDLAATTAAILLDHEARNVLLEADPYHGLFREPLVKLLQTMRTLDFVAAGAAPLTKFRDLEETFRQMVFEAPDVFSFFHHDFAGDGVISATSLVSPVASVLNSPEIINTVNGFESFAKYGLVGCYEPFGYSPVGGPSTKCKHRVPGHNQIGSSGVLNFLPSESLTPAQVVEELNTLMTSGRLSTPSQAIIQQAYEDELLETSNDHERATIRAQQLILTTPEFHSTGRVHPDDASGNRTTPTLPTPSGNPYKAVVFLMLKGGCDSFNMIVPHSCANFPNLTQQYEDERGTLALTIDERDDLVINVTGQPCEQFSLHPELLTLHDMYTAGDLAFFMNTGVLNDETDQSNFRDVTKTQLFSHKDMQAEAQRGDPFDVKMRTGYLGRLADALARNQYQPNTISIDEASVAVQGCTNVSASPTVVNRGGVKEFHPRPSGEDDIKLEALELNKHNHLSTSSIFGETWSARFSKALWEIDVLDEFLTNVSLTTDADADVGEKLAKKFEMIAKLVMTRDNRGVDRDVFFASIGGFDHHDDMKARLTDRFQELDPSLDWFRNELQAQGLWENVTVVAVSDFGRTVTPNSGEGSDHAWGGHYWVAGGAVKGSQALCQYPEDLTENSPLNVGRGRFIPGCSWEAIWHAVTQWMFDGTISDQDMYEVLPNALNTGSVLYNMTDLFA